MAMGKISNKVNFRNHWSVSLLVVFVLFLGIQVASSAAASTTTPSTGSLVVRQRNTLPGEYSTIPQAIRALRGSKGAKTIFIYPGNYNLGVYVNYQYPLTIQGYTTNGNTYAANEVTVSVATGRAESGGDAQSSAIWVQKNDFKMFNINVVNTYGTGQDTQAVALTAQGDRHVYSMCSFSSYQDTLYVKATAAYFLGCNIEGAVDFIFGPGGAWFEGSNIVVKPAQSFATITAQNRAGPSSPARFVFNRSNVVGASGAKAGSAYLGRPWSEYAAVAFQFCTLSDVVNPAGWIPWNAPSDPRTKGVEFNEFQNQGSGSKGTRAIGKTLSQPFRIEQVLGPNYATWTS